MKIEADIMSIKVRLMQKKSKICIKNYATVRRSGFLQQMISGDQAVLTSA